MQTISIQRKPDVLKQLGISATTLHARIHTHKFPPPINLGGRAVGWLSTEVEALIAAMAAGEHDYTLEQVVDFLIEKRVATLRGLFNGH